LNIGFIALTEIFHYPLSLLWFKAHIKYSFSYSIKQISVKQSINVNIAGTQCEFHYRNDSIGDQGVIRQVFIDKDYDITQWPQGKSLVEYHYSASRKQTSLIVDAGANIGASSVYFACIYPNSCIFTIEPEPNNFSLLTQNMGAMNYFGFNGAISNIDGELELFNPGLSDWGFRTKKVNTGSSISTSKVKCISPNTILQHSYAEKTSPLILKIDIEGAEEALFEGNTDWLDKFPLVIIELHDWMLPFSGSSKNFLKAIAQYEFDFLHKGENIFLFNRAILNR